MWWCCWDKVVLGVEVVCWCDRMWWGRWWCKGIVSEGCLKWDFVLWCVGGGDEGGGLVEVSVWEMSVLRYLVIVNWGVELRIVVWRYVVNGIGFVEESYRRE